jgi:hypothetical protein
MVRASSGSEKLPSGQPHDLEHKIRFINLSKRYTFTVKKYVTRLVREKKGVGPVSLGASDASINRRRTGLLNAGKRTLDLINSMLTLSSGTTWPGTGTIRKGDSAARNSRAEEASNGGD